MLSINKKQWKFPASAEPSKDLVAAAGGSALLSAILLRRGLPDPNYIQSFLDPDKYKPSSPMELGDMPAAVNRIVKAVEASERITVYGDYDVDGITGTSLLISVLGCLGAKVDFYIPNRAEEGYGLNLKAVSILASKRQTKLIITCDCGISNFAEINFAKSHGIDTIVVDHHTMPELLPPATAILHPKLLSQDHPLFNLPGVGVAYKFGEALLANAGKDHLTAELLDYVTLGMIADMVPLTKENRYLVQVGLPKLSSSKRPGIQALLGQIGANNGNSSDLVGFGLAPRINAVGRLADANVAVELLTTADTAIAQKLAQQLELDNRRRQELCEAILLEAERMVEAQAGAEQQAQRTGIVIYKEGWHHGVVGIVASRLVEKYHCPVFIGELNPEQGQLKGSARGVETLDLHEVLKANANLLNRWGGHKMAAGFSLDADKAPAFKIAIEQTCKRMLSGATLTPTLEVDALLKPDQVDGRLPVELSALAPFGIGNRKPVLVMEDLKCSAAVSLGKDKKHARLFVQDKSGSNNFEAVYWNHRGNAPDVGTQLDLAFCAEINSFRGTQRLQLVVVDWRIRQEAEASPEQIKPLSTPGVSIQPESMSQSKIAPASRTYTISPAIQLADLRSRSDKNVLLQSSADRADMAIFGENIQSGNKFIDRSTKLAADHVLFWSYPPSLEIFAQVISNCAAQNVHLAGGATMERDTDNAIAFLRHLSGLIRFAVNKRGGIAESFKFSIALGTTDMSIALGLAVLKKAQAIEWYSNNGMLHLNLIGQPTVPVDTVSEYRQLTYVLKGISEFRRWCTDANPDEIRHCILQYVARYNGENTACVRQAVFSGDTPYVQRVGNTTAAPG